MSAIFSWIVGNPLIILGLIGVFTFTSIASDVKAWWSERSAVHAALTPWVQAVSDRDQVAQRQEQILNEAIEAKQKAEKDVVDLTFEYEQEDIRRKLAGAADYNWSDDDLRVLNLTAGKRPATH